MRLTEVACAADIAVLRDGDFRNLGFLDHGHESQFVFLEGQQFLEALLKCENIRAVLTTPELAKQIPGHLALATCGQPRLAFAAIHNHLAQTGFYWEEFATVIDPGADVHPAAWIAPKNVRVGRNSVVGPHATILERCVAGEDVIIGAGAVLGGVGFQTVRASQGMVEMRHAGGLVVHDRVHILPGAVIATGLFRYNTTIGCEARVGSQAFISHGVQVGEHSFVGHGAVVNGNVRIGRKAWVGPGAVISNNLEIGERAFVSLGAVVIRDVLPGEQVSGNFATSHQRLLRHMAEMEAEGSPG
jgi:UDP-3-O-[3-hydroxymyristoyl] glucosamine N-acyltransferase